VADFPGANRVDDLVPELDLELVPEGEVRPGEAVAAALVMKLSVPYLQSRSMKPADLLWVTLGGKRAYLLDHAGVGEDDHIVVPVDPGLVSWKKNRVRLFREAVGDWELAATPGAPVEQFLAVDWVKLKVWTKTTGAM
jgi:hypothetical protein